MRRGRVRQELAAVGPRCHWRTAGRRAFPYGHAANRAHERLAIGKNKLKDTMGGVK
jgi:hypothetical protein